MANQYQHAPKRTTTKKNPSQSTANDPNAIIKPGMSQAAIRAALANRGKKAPKLVDTYGIGPWSHSDSNTTWGAALAWLLDGNTNAYTATKTIVVHGKQYIGNDQDGYVQMQRAPFTGFGNASLESTRKVPKYEGLTGRASFTKTPGRSQPARTENADAVIDGFNGLAKQNPARFGQVQQLLFQSGYYGTAAPVLGSFSGSDQQAFLTAVKDAYTAGMPLQDFLKDRASKAAAQGIGVAPHRVPLTVKYTNPLAIAGAVNTPDSSGTSAAGAAIGRDLTPAELQQYIDKIHAGERLTQTEADNANPTYEGGSAGSAAPPPTPGGQVTDPQGITGAEVDAAMKQAHPVEYAATHMGERASQIYQILSQHRPGGVQV